ncbi:MAG TPA: protein kinase [Kofleriaceae bacterium]|nr:protein kinase [Kofleriaceae bacterium]
MEHDATQQTLGLAAMRIGERIADRYEVRGWIGEGGMGAVYRVHDREIDEEIALKVLRPALAATPEALVRFRREVKLARRVTHPNVARTYDLGEHGGMRFLTMELIDGKPLRGPLGVADALRIAWEVAQGLAAAHAVGVVHRDLKPDNILIAGDRVYLTDFGIAQSDNKDDALRTTGNVIGTPAYIAPEQLEGGSVDGRADVYALGVVVYELLAGQLPFVGETAGSIALARLTRDPVPLHKIAQVPDGVSRLVMDALARKKEQRPDAHSLVARLAKLRGGAPTHDSGLLSTIPIEAIASQRTLRIARPDADAATRVLADDLATAIRDALVKAPNVRVVDDAPEETIESTVRAANQRVRVRLRIVDSRGEAVWAERVEGSLAEPFELEDTVSELVVDAIRTRTTRVSGPQGALRERYDQARALMLGGPAKARDAIAMLEAMLREEPDNAWVASLLAVGVTRLGLQTGADDASLFARAEELALRALDRDPSNGQGYYAIAVVRSVKGEHAEAIAASREALRRAPLLAEPHFLIGRVLGWTGRVAEALQRVDLSIRLDPRSTDGREEKVRLLALTGEREAARRELAELDRMYVQGGVLPRLRLMSWWQDPRLAIEALDIMRAHPTGASWQLAQPTLEAYVRGDLPAMLAIGRETIKQLTGDRVFPRHRAHMFELAVELFLVAGGRDDALEILDELGRMKAFLNLMWLDRCPNLAEVRDHAVFAQTRAATAERVARLFE